MNWRDFLQPRGLSTAMLDCPQLAQGLSSAKDKPNFRLCQKVGQGHSRPRNVLERLL